MLKDKVAVVTGAAQGIGRAVAERYAAEGAKVALVDVNDAGARVAEDLRSRGMHAIYLRSDVADRQSVQQAVQAIRADLGPIDVLVNNAGITRPAMLHKMSDAQWDQV